MSWIKVETNIATKPQIARIAADLHIPLMQAIGACVVFWVWVDGETDDGAIPHATSEIADRIVGLPGFGEALKRYGWLIEDDAGLMVPNFDRHMGESAKSRALAAERQRRFRDRKVGAL